MPEQENQGSTAEIFPIDSKTVQKTLEQVQVEIDRAPEKFFRDEREKMFLDGNRPLISFIEKRSRMHSRYEHDFTEGALLMYRLLRTRAEVYGQSLPPVSEELISAYNHDYLDAVDEGKKYQEIIDGKFELIRAEGSPVFRFLDVVSRYRTGRRSVISGAIHVYDLIERADANSRLEHSFYSAPAGEIPEEEKL